MWEVWVIIFNKCFPKFFSCHNRFSSNSTWFYILELPTPFGMLHWKPNTFIHKNVYSVWNFYQPHHKSANFSNHHVPAYLFVTSISKITRFPLFNLFSQDFYNIYFENTASFLERRYTQYWFMLIPSLWECSASDLCRLLGILSLNCPE